MDCYGVIKKSIDKVIVVPHINLHCNSEEFECSIKVRFPRDSNQPPPPATQRCGSDVTSGLLYKNGRE